MKPEKKIKKYFDSVSVPSSQDVLPDEAFGSEQIGYAPKKKSLGRQFVNGIAYAAVALTLTAVICEAVVMPSLTPRVQPGDGEAESKTKSESEVSKAVETHEDAYNIDILDRTILNFPANKDGNRYVTVYRWESADEISAANEYASLDRLASLSKSDGVAAIVPAFDSFNVSPFGDGRYLCIVDPMACAKYWTEDYSDDATIIECDPVSRPSLEDIASSIGIDVSDQSAIYGAMSKFCERYLVHEEDYIGPYEYKPIFPTFEHSRSIDEYLEHGYKWLGYFMIYADNDLIERLVNEGALIAKLEPAENNGFYYRLPEELVFEKNEDALFEQICKDYYEYLVSIGATVYNDIKPEDIYVQKYFGTYHGCSVVYMGGDGIAFTEALRGVKLGEHTITFRDGQICYVYNNGKFHTVSEAYEKGLINDNDVLTFGPLVSVEDLNTKDIPAEILAAWAEKFGYDNTDDLYFEALYRTENGGYVVLIVNREAVYNDVFMTMDLYGYELCFGNSNLPLYYENGELYDLDECPLTEKDAKGLAKIFAIRITTRQ